MATWPTELPQYPRLSGYNRTRRSSRISFNPDAGRPKKRNRSTAMPIPVTETYILSEGQRQIFESFYETDLGNGAIAFLKRDVDKLVKEFTFDEAEPSWRPAGNLWELTIQLEILP